MPKLNEQIMQLLSAGDVNFVFYGLHTLRFITDECASESESKSKYFDELINNALPLLLKCVQAILQDPHFDSPNEGHILKDFAKCMWKIINNQLRAPLRSPERVQAMIQVMFQIILLNIPEEAIVCFHPFYLSSHILILIHN